MFFLTCAADITDIQASLYLYLRWRAYPCIFRIPLSRSRLLLSHLPSPSRLPPSSSFITFVFLTSRYVPVNAVKYNILVTNWPFANIHHTLQFVTATSPGEASTKSQACRATSSDDSKNLQWFTISVDGILLYLFNGKGSFLVCLFVFVLLLFFLKFKKICKICSGRDVGR